MKNTVTILINKPDTLDIAENLYVGMFLELNIAGLSITVNDFIYQNQLTLQPQEDGTINIGIDNENFVAIKGTTYTDFDEQDDEDYNEFELDIKEATRLVNYILYDLPQTEDDEIEDDEDTHDILYHPQKSENVQTVLDKIEKQENITEQDVELLISNVKYLK